MTHQDVQHQLAQLKESFSDNDLEWRVAHSGTGSNGPWAMIVPYLKKKAIIDRLDQVVGALNWSAQYTKVDGGFLCDLVITFNERAYAKQDGAGPTEVEAFKGGTTDALKRAATNSFKGGITDALKRAATNWGIGLYLHDMPVTFANISDNGKHKAKAKDKSGQVVYFKWDPPKLEIPKVTQTKKPQVQSIEPKASVATKKPTPRKDVGKLKDNLNTKEKAHTWWSNLLEIAEDKWSDEDLRQVLSLHFKVYSLKDLNKTKQEEFINLVRNEDANVFMSQLDLKKDKLVGGAGDFSLQNQQGV